MLFSNIFMYYQGKRYKCILYFSKINNHPLLPQVKYVEIDQRACNILLGIGDKI